MTSQVERFTQTKLVEPMLTERWPKNHKLREPKKFYLKYYEPKQPNIDSILESIDELLPDHKPVTMWSGGKDGRVVLEELIKEDDVTAQTYCKVNGIQNPCGHCEILYMLGEQEEIRQGKMDYVTKVFGVPIKMLLCIPCFNEVIEIDSIDSDKVNE